MDESLPVKPPYWRLSAFYFFYFATIGALFPYWGLYLQTRGYDTLAIGQLLAILAGTKIIAPYVWGWIADHSGRRLLLIRIASLFTAVSFVSMYWADSLLQMAMMMLLFSFFWNASLPQFEVTTLTFLGLDNHRYSSIRLWGSIGFIIAVVAIGKLLDVFGAATLPHIVILLYACKWLATLCVPTVASVTQRASAKSSFWQALRRRDVMVVLFASF